jgi:hypothetical protein
MKPTIKMRRIILFLLLCFLFFFISACDAGSNQRSVSADFFEIDPLFGELYQHLGGLDTLGPGISPVFHANGKDYQYTSSSLMVYDPQAPASHRFQLAPLGLDMGIVELPVQSPTQEGLRYVNGHVIYEEFVPFYEKLGGARFVGQPITEVHFNPETRRYEQHFENLGLYQLEGEAPGSVHTMGYGAWKCRASCRQSPVSNGLVILPPKVSNQFSEAVLALGTDFTGFALTDPYTGPEGVVEQVFENMVLAEDPSSPRRVSLRSITEPIGIAPEPLVPSEYNSGMVFFPIQNGKGHNVPIGFLEFLSNHGGIQTSGPPITEPSQLSDTVFRQCFKNLCLEEHRSPSGTEWIRPAPLGYSYRTLAIQGSLQEPTRFPAPLAMSPPAFQGEASPGSLSGVQSTPQIDVQPSAESFTSSQSFQEVSIQVWETFPMVAPDKGQEIGAAVFEKNQPMASIEPDLVLTLPDGQKKTYYMFPTGADGQTYIQVDPISGPNGTLIPYEVCILNVSGEKSCVKDSFLIWENP